MLSAGCSVMAQAPAAPASGGGAKAGGTAGTTSRTGTNATTNRNNATAPTAGTTTTPNTATNAAPTTTASPNTATGTTAGAGAAPAQGTSPGTTVTGNNVPGTGVNTANGTGTTTRNGASATTGTTVTPAGTLTSTGTIGEFGASDFALQGTTTTSPNATPSNFAFGPDTLFMDSLGNAVPRERFFRRGSKVPATVYYTRQPNGSLVANRVVMTETETPATTVASVESAGTITEVSPGILVIEQPGASNTAVRYVNNKTTNYVNENGEPVAPESVTAGTPVKIFYTKVGDTLVASKVEVHRNNSGLPKPVVPAERSSTRPAKDLPR